MFIPLAWEDGFPVLSTEIPPPGPLYECPTLPLIKVSSEALQSNGTSRRSDDVNNGSKLDTDSSLSTIGLKGGVICLAARSRQSIDLKKGCSLSSAASRSAPRRCLGFRLRSYESEQNISSICRLIERGLCACSPP
jgi:hypothetical protein